MMKPANIFKMFVLPVMLVSGFSTMTLKAGDLNPPGAPTTGTMKTLDEVEPRIPIHQSDIPYTIKQSGSYYLAENVTYSGGGACIFVNANDVVIDLSGYTLRGTFPAYYGINIDEQNNVEIRNGTIRQFSSGIMEAGLSGQNHRILDVRVLGSEGSGILLAGSDNCQIQNCTVADGGTMTDASGACYGIVVGHNCIVSGNTVYNNGIGTTLRPYGISTGNSCRVLNNTVYGNGTSSTADYAVGIWTGHGCTITGNTVYDNGDSTTADYVYGLYAGSSSVASENAVYGNGDTSVGFVYGIYAGGGCTVLNNTIRANGVGTTGTGGVYGLYAYFGNTVNGNTSYDNGDNAACNVTAIFAGSGGTVNSNVAYGNGTSSTGAAVYGIYVNTGGVVTGNTVRSNGSSAGGSVYGIYLAGYNLVNNNAAYSNSGTAGGTNMNTSATSTYGTNCAP